MVRNLPVNAEDERDTCSIPGSGSASGGGNGNPFQYSCLENSMDRGVLGATVHGVTESDTAEHAHTMLYLLLVFSVETSSPIHCCMS